MTRSSYLRQWASWSRRRPIASVPSLASRSAFPLTAPPQTIRPIDHANPRIAVQRAGGSLLPAELTSRKALDDVLTGSEGVWVAGGRDGDPHGRSSGVGVRLDDGALGLGSGQDVEVVGQD